MFRQILAATDLVGVPDPVVLAALTLSVQQNSPLHILHVAESDHTQGGRRVRDVATGRDIDWDAGYADRVRTAIGESLAQAGPVPVPVTIHVMPGFPWEEIVRCSRRIGASMIVLGPHSGRGELKGVVRVMGKIGSTAEGVMMREPCPVMIVNPLARMPKEGFRTIVAGVDFSLSCECALAFARDLAETFGSGIFPFHMIPVPPYPKYSRDDYEADRAAALGRLETFCRDILKDTPRYCGVRGGVLPHLELLRWAAEKGADLIVVGSHTKETDGKWYAGSVVERTAARSSCPVVAVTDPEALRVWDADAGDAEAVGPDKDRSIRVFTRESTRS
ncbi:universal stress protein [Desulfatiferula olefinivorans]